MNLVILLCYKFVARNHSTANSNLDAQFLDALQEAFEQNETSAVFKPHIKKIKSAFYEAQRSVKKRITDASNNTVVKEEDEGNIFEILESMREKRP